MARIVKAAFTYTYGNGGTVVVPQGARVTPVFQEADVFWVDPSIYPAGSLQHFEADHYGIRVPLTNTEEV